MFVEAHKEVEEFTRSVRSIYRYLDSKVVKPGTATAMIVNDEGWLLTCKHVGKVLINQKKICDNYSKFKKELDEIQKKPNTKSKAIKLMIKNLKKKYKYTFNSIIQIDSKVSNWIDGETTKFKFYSHPKYDIMLLKPYFTGTVSCKSFPVFFKEEVFVGKSLCKTGFPFAEFNNFAYDESTDSIKWTSSGHTISPYFALDGIVTRRISDNGTLFAFEMGTPGIKGQSGGPVFDSNGYVYGMQSQTKHLDLDLKSTKEIFDKGKKKTYEENAFMYVGVVVSSQIIMEFMDSHGCKYNKSS